MIDGEYIPVAVTAAPNTAPATRVVMDFESILDTGCNEELVKVYNKNESTSVECVSGFISKWFFQYLANTDANKSRAAISSICSDDLYNMK